ncbi:hypothetical protein D3C72_1520650 [compost metagenome]
MPTSLRFSLSETGAVVCENRQGLVFMLPGEPVDLPPKAEAGASDEAPAPVVAVQGA